MRVSLVTGGAGFLGSHLCDYLLERGEQVICLDNLETGRAENVAGRQLAFVTHDVTEPFPELGHVDYVYHLASPASPQHYRLKPRKTLNVAIDGTRNAIAFAERTKAGLLLASSSEVYGDPQVHPQPETYYGNVNPVGPRGPYGEGKRIAETMVEVARGDLTHSTIARPFNVYGPRLKPDDGRVVPTFVSQALAGEPLTVFGDGSQTRSLCYVSDAVEGLYALALSGHPGPMNLGNPTEVTMLELAQTVLDVAGVDGHPGVQLVAASGPYGEGNEAHQRCPDISLAQHTLGWWPKVGLAEGIAETVRAARG